MAITPASANRFRQLPWLGALVLLAASCGGSSTAGTSSAQSGGGIVRTVKNPQLGSTVLTDSSGMTLYTLSAEKRGHFICTKGATVPGDPGTSCLSLWVPLTLPTGQAPPTSIQSLGAIKRPDGVGRQLTYQGRPLYTFVEDKQAGDVRGNGFKDVGTWRPAVVGAGESQQPSSSTQGGYGY